MPRVDHTTTSARTFVRIAPQERDEARARQAAEHAEGLATWVLVLLAAAAMAALPGCGPIAPLLWLASGIAGVLAGIHAEGLFASQGRH